MHFETIEDTIPRMEKHEIKPAVYYLLRADIESGKLTLPNGKKTSLPKARYSLSRKCVCPIHAEPVHGGVSSTILPSEKAVEKS